MFAKSDLASQDETRVSAQEISPTGASDATGVARTRQGGIRRWLGLVVFVVVVFAAPAALLRFSQDSSFDEAALNSLNRQQPEIVFIGNSMLETRIDPVHLTELLNGREVASLAVPGSQSAVWYLQLKKLVAATDRPPETVFVFFRNDLITQPLAPLDDRNRELVESLEESGDTEYEAALESSRSLHQQMVNGLELVYPVQLENGEALKAISQASAALLPSTHQELSARSEDRFAFHNLREADLDEPPPKAQRPFGEAVGSSFLPLMLQVAADSGISLVFVRVQARPNVDGTVRESESMAAYSKELADFLAQSNVGYIDFTGNPSVDRALYYDSFHIRQLYLLDYTELFLREAQGFLDDGAGQGG